MKAPVPTAPSTMVPQAPGPMYFATPGFERVIWGALQVTYAREPPGTTRKVPGSIFGLAKSPSVSRLRLLPSQPIMSSGLTLYPSATPFRPGPKAPLEKPAAQVVSFRAFRHGLQTHVGDLGHRDHGGPIPVPRSGIKEWPQGEDGFGWRCLDGV